MTRGERVVNGMTLRPVLAYWWEMYTLATDTRQAYESGVGEWTVSHTDPTTGRVSIVDTWWSLADALQGARAHRQQIIDGGIQW